MVALSVSQRERTLRLLILGVFAAIFLSLTVTSYRGMSATVDEPVNLTSGYLGLHAHDYRIDPLHPPFIRMWAALPLLLMRNVNLPDRSIIDKADPLGWLYNPGLDNEFGYADKFIFRINDAERLLFPGRFMIALLAVFLGIMIFCWAHEWLGLWPAIMALG